jgi:hypothetical protein
VYAAWSDCNSRVHNYQRPATATSIVAINGSPADVASGAGRNVVCVKDGFLVCGPHRAWQRAWSESAQQVNDMAIGAANVVIELTPAGVAADGTIAE